MFRKFSQCASIEMNIFMIRDHRLKHLKIHSFSYLTFFFLCLSHKLSQELIFIVIFLLRPSHARNNAQRTKCRKSVAGNESRFRQFAEPTLSKSFCNSLYTQFSDVASFPCYREKPSIGLILFFFLPRLIASRERCSVE